MGLSADRAFEPEIEVTVDAEEAADAALANFSSAVAAQKRGKHSALAALAALAGGSFPIDPTPLISGHPEGDDFPVSVLNGRFGTVVRALQNATQAPIGLCANSILADGSVVFQGLHDVMLPKNRPRPISLCIVTVASSGERKSSADRIAKEALEAREKELQAQSEDEFRRYRKDLQAYESAEKEALSKAKGFQAKKDALYALGPKPIKPLDYKLSLNDWTLEGLIKDMHGGQPSFALLTDEGGQIFGGHSMKAENRVATVAGLSKLWDGSHIDRCRASDPERIEVRNRRLSSHIMIQPELCGDLLKDAKIRGQGMFSRMLISYPTSTCGTRFFQDENPDATKDLEEFKDFLLSVLRCPLPIIEGTRNELDPPALEMDDEAERLWIEYFNETEAELAPGGKFADHKDWVSKSGEHAGRIAAVLTLIEDPDATSIPVGRMFDAIELTRYYLSEFCRLMGADFSEDSASRNADIIWKWLTDKKKWPHTHVSPADISQKGPGSVRKGHIIRNAISHLVSNGLLQRVHGKVRIGDITRAEAYLIIDDKGA